MKKLFTYLGAMLLLAGLFRLLPLGVALHLDEPLSPILWSLLFTFSIGLLFLLIGLSGKDISLGNLPDTLTLMEALMLTVLFFLMVSLLGSISYLPYVQSGGPGQLVDAFFESVSGFTTTGLSVLPELDGLPSSLLLWRAETQWIGGLGIVILFVYLLSLRPSSSSPSSEPKDDRVSTLSMLFRSQGYSAKIESSIKKTAGRMMLIYLTYTVIGVLLLLTGGQSLLDSLGLTFSSLSTGGFAMGDTLPQGAWSLGVLCFLMIIGATSFVVHQDIFRWRWKEVWRNQELLFMIGLFLLGVFISLMVLPIGSAIFHTVSAMTTTGFSLQALHAIPALVLFTMGLLMIIGGSLGSTAGGMKLYRVLIQIRGIGWVLKKISLPPTAVVPFSIKKERFELSEVLFISLFGFAFLLLLLLSTFLLLFLGFGFQDAAFLSVSSLGTVGLSTVPLASAPFLAKLVLILNMLLGRLEIFPLLLVVRQLWVRS